MANWKTVTSEPVKPDTVQQLVNVASLGIIELPSGWKQVDKDLDTGRTVEGRGTTQAAARVDADKKK